jgi:hypothetical protein
MNNNITDLPDPYKFLDGSIVTSPDNWSARAKEISGLYQYYMYGTYRDGSLENLSYDITDTSMSIKVERKGLCSSFRVNIQLPVGNPPHEGWPVIVCLNAIPTKDYAVSRRYAVITLNTSTIAEDNNMHSGAFYTLYPYGDTPEEQTGVLLAWSWGAGKVMDALYQGAGIHLQINPVNSILAGVSRWGKAALVCGAYDKRFKMVVPSCSGAGGTVIFRYTSEGKSYDFHTIGGPDTYTYNVNEALVNLQSSYEQGWFNTNFLKLTSVNNLPFDQHMLCSLCADPNRYLFIIGACTDEDWINAPSMWLSYKATKHVFDYLGLGNHIAVNMHLSGHDIIQEDMLKMLDYFDYNVYGKVPHTTDLSALSTSVFDLPSNHDPLFDHFDLNWTYTYS